ncbi:MAG TPA: IS1634 family transposase [Clostridiaceae bacterium]|nr:IS1634 family transposase [Clostridiaceae bacterium]HJJ05649.1 IS1634 family transposase [Clostridiaceae bacterium]
MRLSIVKSPNAKQFYIIESFTTKTGKRTSRIVEKLGNENEVIKKANGEDPVVWAKRYIDNLNKAEKENNRKILFEKSTSKLIEKNKQNLFNCGYLFLEKIYYDLNLNKICEDISDKYSFKYDLNNILSRLLYGRIIFPSSKLATYNLSKKFIEQPNFELQHIYRALEVIAKENEFIQAELYKNSLKKAKRNTGVLYYDCTNFFFELEQEDGLKQYGPSKENKNTPIVQMGLFMDGDGIPLAFNITPGNTNEQTTLTPTEQKILDDFKLSKFIVCTDAGLASTTNRKFNDKEDRAFITTQSIKKLKKHLKEWALSPTGWNLNNDTKQYDISKLEDTSESIEKYKSKVFYKERWIKENGLEQKLIVTFSLKYKFYQQRIRNNQIERAQKAIKNKSFKLDKINQNDFKRFITKTPVTKDGEVAEKKILSLNTNQIEKEQIYDGFYGVCTNLEDNAEEIIKVNQRRWEIEESFRIIKSEFKARPVYLSRDDRIIAHFTTCFLSLVLHRYLEKELNEKYTASEIIDTLREMNLSQIDEIGYIPVYTRTDITDCLHETFNFRTDSEITTKKIMKKILKNSKK